MIKDLGKIFKDVEKGLNDITKEAGKFGNDIANQAIKIGGDLADGTKDVLEKSTDVIAKSVEGDGCALLGKSLLGATIGVCAIAAAPFTGGGSVLAGVTLAGSLGTVGAVAGAAVVGTVGAVGGAMVQGLENIDKEEQIKRAKSDSFKDGLNEGKALTVEQIKKYADFCMATTALSYYIARCDGTIDDEEMLELEFDLNAIKKNKDLPDAIKNELSNISRDTTITFDDVKKYLDKIGLETLKELEKDINEIIEANGVISPEEEIAKNDFVLYLRQREKSVENK